MMAQVYQWLDCNADYAAIDGATEQTYTPSENGSFAVIITKDGCVDTTDCILISDAGYNHTLKELIQVYPNPNNGEFKIYLGTTYSEINYEIRNVLSQKIAEGLVSNTDQLELTINASDGIYFAHLTLDTGEKVIVKIMKKKSE